MLYVPSYSPLNYVTFVSVFRTTFNNTKQTVSGISPFPDWSDMLLCGRHHPFGELSRIISQSSSATSQKNLSIVFTFMVAVWGN